MDGERMHLMVAASCRRLSRLGDSVPWLALRRVNTGETNGDYQEAINKALAWLKLHAASSLDEAFEAKLGGFGIRST